MDKVFIKPTSKEILIKDSNKEGYLDIYSYDYNTDQQKRKLGSLYIIGNVNQTSDKEEASEDLDIAYMVNLVASLAKREYYSKPDVAPKQAFSGTLKKINEIVEEFFKNKGAKVNIGIFAVAGDEILISKLGKFKVLLSRNSEIIDVLNNVSLFSKDHVDEREFSNIISGKIKSGDKLLAFYPSRFITSREKVIKDHFVKLSWVDFLEKINTIKTGKAAACAALYIDINKVKESAIRPAPQPKELKPKKAHVMSDEARLISADGEMNQTSTAIELEKPELPSAHEPVTPQPAEIPKIISSEFSSARKENIFSKLFAGLRQWLPAKRRNSLGRIGTTVSWHPSFKRQLMYATPALVLIVAGAWMVKSYVFISAEEKESNRIAQEIQENINLIESKIQANNLAEARTMLLSSLLNSSLPAQAEEQMNALLDQADNAISINPILIESLPEEITKKIELFTLLGDDIKANKYGLSSEVIDFDLYENNLYLISGSNIFKIIDAAKGSQTTVSWLKEGVSTTGEPVEIVVDGDIFVLSKSGAITKYYRGDKVYEQETAILSENSSLLTAKDIPNLYIVNEGLGRIYVIDKESASIIKVLKLGNTQPFTASWVDATGIVYLGSPDGKIWKVE